MLQLIRADHQAVFRGRAVSAKAESSRKDKARGWILGPACGRPGMTRSNKPITLQANRVHGFGSIRSKTIVI
jgi:hypothetical protein